MKSGGLKRDWIDAEIKLLEPQLDAQERAEQKGSEIRDLSNSVLIEYFIIKFLLLSKDVFGGVAKNESHKNNYYTNNFVCYRSRFC
jgi:hypothetical protein